MSASKKREMAKRTKSEWREITEKATKTMIARYGSRAGKNRARGSWKAGWRVVGGRKIYFRSKWEANYGRYLEFLKSCGEVKEWLHEPKTFWFEKIKRGCRSYLPDFRVVWADGKEEYHEVKGWMDKRSITKIKRMRIYHPKVVLRVLDGKWFSENTRKLKSFVPEWE